MSIHSITNHLTVAEQCQNSEIQKPTTSSTVLIGDAQLRRAQEQMEEFYRFSSSLRPNRIFTDLTSAEKSMGHLTYPNGALYEGEIVDGKAHGKGKKTHLDGRVYEGEFVAGIVQGKGKLTYRSGEIYEGEFVAGRMLGQGKEIRPDGRVFEGEFVDGRLRGDGKCKETRLDGAVCEGERSYHQMYGDGKITYPNGDVLEGAVFSSKFCGNGKLTRSSGLIIEGGVDKERLYGICSVTFPSGVVEKVSFVNGNPHRKGKIADLEDSIESNRVDDRLHEQTCVHGGNRLYFEDQYVCNLHQRKVQKSESLWVYPFKKND